jgi:glutaredoxin
LAVVTVYSPSEPCNQCSSTKLRLKQKHIPFESVTADQDAINRFRDEGHSSFPVVVVDFSDEATWSWSGFRFDHITRLADLIDEKAA